LKIACLKLSASKTTRLRSKLGSTYLPIWKARVDLPAPSEPSIAKTQSLSFFEVKE